MSALLGKSLQDVTTQRDRPNSRGASRGALHGSRTAPYNKPGDGWQHDMFQGSGQRRYKTRSDQDDDMLDGDGDPDRPSNKLRVEDLHYEVSERELQALFSQVGSITDGPRIKFDKSGRSEGIAWVTFSSVREASRAKDEFDGCPAKGQKIRVVFDYSRARGIGEGAALLARMGGLETHARDFFDTGSRARGRGRGRGVSSRGLSSRGGGRGAARPSGPRTEADLDAELDAFMKG